ncbi:DNA repair endonuclease [Entamoeba marina]
MEEFIDKVSTNVINGKTLTILSHGYLLPQIVLSSIHQDINTYVSKNHSLPTIFLLNAPPHIFQHIETHSTGLTYNSTFLKQKKKSVEITDKFKVLTQNSQADSSISVDTDVSHSNTNVNVNLPFIKLDYKQSTDSRKQLYKNGGIFAVTARILITDLISMDYDWNNSILYILDVELIPDRFNLAFISQVYNSLTTTPQIRGFSQKPQTLVFHKKTFEIIRKILQVPKVMMFSYSFPALVTIRSNFKRFRVIPLKLKMEESTKLIETLIFELMKTIAKEIRYRSPRGFEEFAEDSLLFGEFEKEAIRLGREKGGDSELETMCVDLKSLRQLLFSLYISNPVLFYIQVEAMRMLIWGSDSIYWLGTKTCSSFFEATKGRMWKGDEFHVEEQPKHSEVKNIIKHENEKGNDVVIIVKNQQTKDELSHSLDLTHETLLDFYQQWFDRKNELQQMLKDIHINNRNDAQSKQKKWKLFNNGNYTSDVKNLSKELNNNDNKDGKDSNSDGNNDELLDVDDNQLEEVEVRIGYKDVVSEMSQKLYEMHTNLVSQTQQRLATQILMTQQVPPQHNINEDQSKSDIKISNNINDTTIPTNVSNNVNLKEIDMKTHQMPVNKIVTQNELSDLFTWDKPKSIILYNCSLWVTRVIEVFSQSQEELITLYMMSYEDSYEEIKYQQTIRREKAAFEKLISQEAKLEELHIKQHKIEGIKTTEMKDKIIVDIREFRSELPLELFLHNFQLIPKQIEIGDFLLSPDICVERKAPMDLVGSLKSKRIQKQLLNMQRKYKTPVLLIECYATTAFQTYDFTRIDKILQKYIPLLTDLIKDMPHLKIIWSYSPTMTATIFKQLKENQPQPTEDDCKQIMDNDDETNWNAVEVLKHLPGVPSSILYDLQHSKVDNFARMIALPKEQLVEILGTNASAEQFISACNYHFETTK